MSYTYRSKGTTGQRSELHKQKLNQALLTRRKVLTSISARLNALSEQIDREVAQAIWDDVAVRTVAAAAGITVSRARSLGLAFETLRSDATAKAHIETLRDLTQQAATLRAEQEELRRQQEQLVVTALQTGLLDAPWLAALSGLTLERVNMLGQQTRRNASTVGPNS